MSPRRERDPASLIARVRWGNLARLAAIVGAGALIALGPRGCGGGQDGLPALPVDPPAATPPPAPPALAPPAPPRAARPKPPAKPRASRKGRRARRRRPARHPNRPTPSPSTTTPPPAPVTPPAPSPRRRWVRPAPRTPEFL